MRLKIILAFLITIAIGAVIPRPLNAQSADLVIGKGELCSSAENCIPIEVEFPPSGGEVNGFADYFAYIPNPPETDCRFSVSGTMEGLFTGGDGGIVTGTFTLDQTFACESGSSFNVWSGSWSGNLNANGAGSGTWSASTGAGTWSIWYDSDAFLAGLEPSPSVVITIRPSATLTDIPVVTPTVFPMDETVQAFLDSNDSQQFAKEHLQRVLNHDWSQGPYVEPWPYIVWLNNRVVSLNIDENQQPYVMDDKGNTVKINEELQPLEPYDHLESMFSGISELQQVPSMDLVDYLLLLQQQLPVEMAPILDAPMDLLVYSDGLSSEELKIVLRNLNRIKETGLENNIDGFKQVINRYMSYKANIEGTQQGKQMLDHELEKYGMVGLMERWNYLKEDLETIRKSDTVKPELIEKIDLLLGDPRFSTDAPANADMYWYMRTIRLDQLEFEGQAREKRDDAFEALERELGALRLTDAIEKMAENKLISQEQAQLYLQRATQGMLKTKDIRNISKQYKTFQSILEMQAPPPESPTGLKATDALLNNKITITLCEMFDD